MIMNSTVNDVFTSGVTGTEQFKFSNSPIIFKILSDSLYSDKIGSIVRELASNARDAHIAAGKADVPFEISIPNSWNMFNSTEGVFSVKDYGIGLSEEEIYNLYTVYGESNKRSSNDFVGGFGIGSKSPFAYTDTFTIISRYNGVETTYSAFINSDGFPSITKVFSQETEEGNGVEVSFRITKRDAHLFENAVDSQLFFFNPFPKINGNIPRINETLIKVLEGTGWFVGKFTTYNTNGGKVFALVGDIPYEIPMKNINECISGYRHTTYITFPIGSLDLSASREAIAFTEKSKDAIKKRITEVKEELIQNVKDHIKDMPVYEKMCYVHSLPIRHEEYRNVKGYEDIEIFAQSLRFRDNDFDKKLVETGCTVRWWDRNKWKNNNNMYSILPSKDMHFIYVPLKSTTLESIAKYLKKEGIISACVLRYKKREDITYFNEVFGCPPIEEPEIESIEKTKKDASKISYRLYSSMNGGCYSMVANSQLYDGTASKVMEVAKDCPFVLLCNKYGILISEDWTVERINTFLTRLNKIITSSSYRIRSLFGNVLILSETSYRKMKKEGLKVSTFDECMAYINAFHKEHFEFSGFEEEAKNYSSNTANVMSVLVNEFTKEECCKYAKKNELFAYAHKLYDILKDEERAKFFSEYSHTLLDKRSESVYDEYILNEPLLCLTLHKHFWKGELRACLVRYLNLEN